MPVWGAQAGVRRRLCCGVASFSWKCPVPGYVPHLVSVVVEVPVLTSCGDKQHICSAKDPCQAYKLVHVISRQRLCA